MPDVLEFSRSAALRDQAQHLDGFLDGTLLATTTGWRRVENLRAGDQLLTLDNGPQRLLGTFSASAVSEGSRMADWPKLVPDGVLGNRGTLRLLPDQIVGIEGDAVRLRYGEALALSKARDLQGWRGICAVPPVPQARVWTLQLGGDEILFAAGGVLAFCKGRQGQTLGAAATPSAQAGLRFLRGAELSDLLMVA